VRIGLAECARFPKQRSSASGESDLRGMQLLYPDVQTVDIPLLTMREQRLKGMTKEDVSVGREAFKCRNSGNRETRYHVSLRHQEESKSQDAGNTDSSAFEKNLVEEHMVIRTANRHWCAGRVYQGKRATAVQGTRQQKLGVTYGRCLAWRQLCRWATLNDTKRLFN